MGYDASWLVTFAVRVRLYLLTTGHRLGLYAWRFLKRGASLSHACHILLRYKTVAKQALPVSHSTTSMHREKFFFRVGGIFLRGVAAHRRLKDYIAGVGPHIFIDCAFSFRVQYTTRQSFTNTTRTKDTAMANYIHVPDEAPVVPKIDVTVDERDYRSGALSLIKELRPHWKPSEVKVKVPFHSLISMFAFSLLSLGCVRISASVCITYSRCHKIAELL